MRRKLDQEGLSLLRIDLRSLVSGLYFHGGVSRWSGIVLTGEKPEQVVVNRVQGSRIVLRNGH